MNIEPVATALGAEVHGVDLSETVSANAAAQIRRAFLTHRVLVFRDQRLSAADLIRFGELFGELDLYPFIKGLAEAPQVIEILKTESDSVNFGGSWHSDMSYMERPPMATALYAVEVPAAGGDTQFANTTLAYEALSAGMRRMLAGLRAVNSSEGRYAGGRAAAMSRLDGMKNTYQERATVHESEHPVVRTHPETGRHSLYVNAIHSHCFTGMSTAESRPILDYLCSHMVRPEFTCRLRWRVGSLAVWDNRTTLHYALNDYQGVRRRMRRIIVKGERPE